MYKIAILYQRNTTESPYELYLGTIASILEKNSNLDISYYGTSDYNEDAFQHITNNAPDAVYLHLGFGNYKWLCKFGEKIKESNQDIFIVCGFEVPTFDYKMLLLKYPWIDSAIVGEPEETIEELFKAKSKKSTITTIAGMAYHNDRIIKYVGNRNLIEKIDNLPFPKRFILQTNGYYILGARGCVWRCSYCDRNRMNIPTMCNTQRYRSITNIVEEIDFLVNNYQCKHITFFDASFVDDSNMNSRLIELFNGLRSKQYWVQFFLFMRPTQINNETISLLTKLKEVGLHRVFIGIETGNEDDLILYRKPITLKTSEHVFNMFNSLKTDSRDPYILYPEYGFINFNPFTTVKNLQKNLDFLHDNKVELNPYLLLTKSLIYPGTELAEKVIRDKLNISPNDDIISFRFQNPEIEKIFQNIDEFTRILEYTRMEKYIIIYNRYVHFFHDTDLSSTMKMLYNSYIKEVSEQTYEVAKLIYSQQQWLKVIEKKKNRLNKTFMELHGKYVKMLISLQKIGESSY